MTNQRWHPMINRLRTASDLVNQLAAACAWHDKEVARIKAEFNAELVALYKELAELKAMLTDLQILDAAKSERGPETALH